MCHSTHSCQKTSPNPVAESKGQQVLLTLLSHSMDPIRAHTYHICANIIKVTSYFCHLSWSWWQRGVRHLLSGVIHSLDMYWGCGFKSYWGHGWSSYPTAINYYRFHKLCSGQNNKKKNIHLFFLHFFFFFFAIRWNLRIVNSLYTRLLKNSIFYH